MTLTWPSPPPSSRWAVTHLHRIHVYVTRRRMNLLLLLLLFLQELQEVGNSFARAPKCSWSPIPPPELRGENVHHLTTNGGFVSFGTSSTKFLSVDTRAHGPAVRLQLSSGPAGLRVYISISSATWAPMCRRPVAAREGEAGRQDRVDPAQLPVLRQVPHQGSPATGSHRPPTRPRPFPLLPYRGWLMAAVV